MKTASVNIRMEPETKRKAEMMFKGLGITLADAFNIFVCQSLLRGGMPFDVRYPNHEILSSLQQSIKDREDGFQGYSLDEVFSHAETAINKVAENEV